MTLAIADSHGNMIDITACVAENGIKWHRNDIDGPNAGRNIDGTMERDRVATKIRMDVTCVFLTYDELKQVFGLIYPEYIQVYYNDPLWGTRTVWMYSNNHPATFSHYDTHGVELWKEVTFPLIEV